MEAKILNGKVVSKELEESVRNRVSEYVEKYGKAPILATIIVGEDPGSKMYVKMKSKACDRVGIDNRVIALDDTITTEGLLSLIDELNNNEDVDGILIQHPLPRTIDEKLCFDAIALEKDIDGVNSKSFGAVTMGQDAFASATPSGIMEILKYYDIDVSGKHAVVVGRSPILGKPVSMLLLNSDATVTICHTKTKNIAEILKTADIVVAACGSPEFVQKDWLKEGVVIVDAGYNKGNIGDVSKEAYEIASAYTPVPGGVGPMTIAETLEHTITSAEKKQKRIEEDKKKVKTISVIVRANS